MQGNWVFLVVALGVSGSPGAVLVGFPASGSPASWELSGAPGGGLSWGLS